MNNKRIILNSGECWYLRLSDPHRVGNFSAEDRVHLVIDATVNDWITEMFEKVSMSKIFKVKEQYNQKLKNDKKKSV